MVTEIVLNNAVEELDNNLSVLKQKVFNETSRSENLYLTRKFLQEYVPREVLMILDFLTNTVLNDLMKEAVKVVNTYDIKLQRIFYDRDIRTKIKDKLNARKSEITDENTIRFSFDPRLKSSIIAGGATFGIGSAITIFVPKHTILTILTGLLTVILTGLVVKTVYNKKTPEAKKQIGRDVIQYIDNVRNQTIKFIEVLINEFKLEFENIIAEIEKQKED